MRWFPRLRLIHSATCGYLNKMVSHKELRANVSYCSFFAVQYAFAFFKAFVCIYMNAFFFFFSARYEEYLHFITSQPLMINHFAK